MSTESPPPPFLVSKLVSRDSCLWCWNIDESADYWCSVILAPKHGPQFNSEWPANSCLKIRSRAAAAPKNTLEQCSVSAHVMNETQTSSSFEATSTWHCNQQTGWTLIPHSQDIFLLPNFTLLNDWCGWCHSVPKDLVYLRNYFVTQYEVFFNIYA